jgi:hypothetical protein
MDEDVKLIKFFNKWMNTDSQHACVNMYLNSSQNKVQRFARYCYNNDDNFHILDIHPVYGYMENKVNE